MCGKCIEPKLNLRTDAYYVLNTLQNINYKNFITYIYLLYISTYIGYVYYALPEYHNNFPPTHCHHYLPVFR